MVTAATLRNRLRGWPNDAGRAEGLFTMNRRVGLLVNLFAVIYGGFMTVNLVWPRAYFYGPAWYQQYAGLIFVPIVIVGGAVFYRLRKATHRSMGQPMVDQGS
jgi:hypothetical protein